MTRMTRTKDKYSCRIAGGCPAEDWVCDNIEGELTGNLCTTRPFE